MYARHIILTIAILVSLSTDALCQQPKLNFPLQVSQLQKHNAGILRHSADTILSVLKNSVYKGLDPERYHISSIQQFSEQSKEDSSRNSLIADGLITYCRDIQQAHDISRHLSYDEISGKYAGTGMETIISNLTSIRSASALLAFLTSIEPDDNTYNALLHELRIQIDSNDKKKIKSLKLSLAYYRWVQHFDFEKKILVNIPSATLITFEHNKETLNMKVVVGKPSTRTPRFAAYCNQVILYPYWHVPRSIAVNEILPKCKKNAATPGKMNLQVLNSKGQVVNPSKINWASYSSKNFPYTFRQTTGCGNALGVIKFNITNPFSVYLHDTNFKDAFQNKRRFLSHGCIRLEKPIELANFILTEKIDEAFLTSCIRDQKPVVKTLSPVTVFVVYMPATPDSSGTVIYHDDVYKLL